MKKISHCINSFQGLGDMTLGKSGFNILAITCIFLKIYFKFMRKEAIILTQNNYIEVQFQSECEYSFFPQKTPKTSVLICFYSLY